MKVLAYRESTCTILSVTRAHNNPSKHHLTGQGIHWLIESPHLLLYDYPTLLDSCLFCSRT